MTDPRYFLPASRLGPLGAYGGPAGYTEISAEEAERLRAVREGDVSERENDDKHD